VTISVYEVRFSVRRGGAIQAERFGRGEAGLENAVTQEPGTFAIRQLEAWQGALREPIADPEDRAKLRRALRFWRRVLEVEVRGEPRPAWMNRRLADVRSRITWLGPNWTFRRGKRYQLVMRWAAPMGGDVVYLSILYGALARTLRLCRECGAAFVTDLRHLNRRTCDAHRKEARPAGHRAVGLSRRLVSYWTKLRRRMNQRVRRRRLTPNERDTILDGALADLRHVGARRMSLEEWQRRWDQRGKPGRPRKHQTTTTPGR
jgi:hypothetical protein